jgi:putative ABC transport system permease protein
MMIFIIGVFAIFFVSYAHSSFNKSRSKEFGLYLTLGMTNKDISKLVRIENSILIFFSMITGLITGTVFSKLFFLIVVNLLNLKSIKFMLSYKSYLLTIFIFIFIFLIVIVMGKRMASKLVVAQLLKGNKKNVIYRSYNPLVGIIGIILTLFSLIAFDMFLKKQLLSDLRFLPLIFIGLSILGIYLSIAHLGSTLIFFSKKFRNKYFKNIINITEIQNKFSEYKKILFVMTLLTIIVIYFIGMSYSSYSLTAAFAKNENPYHLMYVVRQNDNNSLKNKFNKIIRNKNIEVKRKISLEYLEAKIYKNTAGKKGWFGWVEVISEKEFNSLSNHNLSLKKGEAVTLVKLSEPEKSQWFNDKELRLQIGDAIYDFKFKKEITKMLINNSKRTSRFMVIINTDEYQKIHNTVNSDRLGVFNLFDFKDWKDAEVVSTKLSQYMETNLTNYQQNNSSVVRYEVTTRIQLFRTLKEQYAIYLFLMSFVGLLFFISSGSILYLKLLTDIDDMKIKYKKLFRIGITSHEFKKIVTKDLSFIFFVPLILGSGLGLTFIMITTTNFALQQELVLNTLIVTGIYGALQIIFYQIARRKYLQKIR